MAARSLLRPGALPFRPGPVFDRLPWRTHAAAERALPDAARRRFEAGRAILKAGWQRPYGGVVHALEAVFPGNVVLVDASGYDNSRIVTNIRGRVSSDARDVANHEAVRRYRSTTRLAELDNRPINATEMARPLQSAGVFEGVWNEVILANDVTTQIRLLASEHGERQALFAIYRRLSRGTPRDFDADDHALLHAITPELLAWVTLTKLLGLAPIGSDAAIAALDLVDSPVWFVHQWGAARRTLAWANAAARARYGVTPPWVLHPVAGEAALGIVRSPLGGSAAMTVVTQRAAAPVAGDGQAFAALAGLPVYLARVAMGLRDGLSDKEIALRTGLSLRTVRTYVTRVLAHEKVDSRRALVARWRDL